MKEDQPTQDSAKTETDQNTADMKITDLIKMQTLAHRSQIGWNSRDQREMIWNFYMPYNIDRLRDEKL